MIAKTQILIKECSTSYQYLLIQSVFTKNYEMMKQSEKARLKNKFDWLFNKQRELGISNNQNTGFEEPIVEPQMERITPIQVELTPDEQSVLALGPNFALTPRIDDRPITNVQVEFASSAYQLRWRKHMEEVQDCRTHAQHLKTLGAPISKSYVHPPPNNNTEVEDNLTRFNNFVIHLYKNSKIDFNLTPSQAAGLKSLIRKKDELHFSVSDKGGEFVIIDKAAHRNLNEHHIASTEGVYKYIPPTRTYRGEDRQIITPTEISFHRQIKSRTEIIQRKCNELWKNICEKRKFYTDVMRYFISHNTQLPTMYVLLKTHKFQVSDISSINDIFEKCKVRPIVSCCGSPCEKLAWLCTHILSELLNHVPSHLNNIFEHLNKLTDIPPAQLEGKKFCSGDISSLYKSEHRSLYR